MKIIISIVVIVLVVLFFYKLLTFSLFDEDNAKLKVIDVPNKEYRLNLYYIPANATNQSYIQVRQEKKDREHVLNSYEMYNYLVSYSINEKYLKLVLKDTGSISKRADTVLLKLP